MFSDTLRGGRSIDSFLWHGDQKAGPVERAGLVVFALGFLIPMIGFAYLIATRPSWTEKTIFSFIELILGYVIFRLIRNAILRQRDRSKGTPDSD